MLKWKRDIWISINVSTNIIIHYVSTRFSSRLHVKLIGVLSSRCPFKEYEWLSHQTMIVTTYTLMSMYRLFGMSLGVTTDGWPQVRKHIREDKPTLTSDTEQGSVIFYRYYILIERVWIQCKILFPLLYSEDTTIIQDI